MENTQRKEKIVFLSCQRGPALYKEKKKIPPKFEKPLKTVSMLKSPLWETEIALFGASEGELIYPSSLKEKEIRNILKKMKRRRKKWLLWLVLVFPLTFILTPIPGPNIAYYYVLGRIILHFKSIRGIKNLLRNFKFLEVDDIEPFLKIGNGSSLC